MRRLAPLTSGRETDIDMIEREMEGGVVILQPLEVYEHSRNRHFGGLVTVAEDVEIHEIATASKPPKA